MNIEQEIFCIRTTIEILARIDKLDEISSLLETFEPILPKNVIGYDLLSFGYMKAKKYEKAIYYGELALGCTSGKESLAVRHNLGKLYLNANYPEKSRDTFDLLLKLTDEPELKLDLSASLYACNQKEESNKILMDMYNNLESYSENTQNIIKFNLGSHFITRGDFKKGMKYLTLGRKIKVWGSYSHKLPIPEWDEVSKGNILIIGEGGIGDELINARFAKHLSERGNIVDFASCHKLSSIIQRIPGINKAINYDKILNDIPDIMKYDYWVPAMSLPKFLRLDFQDLWYGSYLTIDEEYNEKWKKRIGGDKLKVGLRWSGNPLYEQQLNRKLSLHELYEIVAQNANFDLYSIQKGDTQDLINYPDIIDLENELETFEDCLACLNNLDLVVTSCTSVAHASAALGKKTIVLVPIMDYYVWGEGLSTSSWYGDNLILLRQDEVRSWKNPLSKLNSTIEKMLCRI